MRNLLRAAGRAVGSGRFLTPWSIAASLTLSLTVMAPTGDGVDPLNALAPTGATWLCFGAALAARRRAGTVEPHEAGAHRHRDRRDHRLRDTASCGAGRLAPPQRLSHPADGPAAVPHRDEHRRLGGRAEHPRRARILAPIAASSERPAAVRRPGARSGERRSAGVRRRRRPPRRPGAERLSMRRSSS